MNVTREQINALIASNKNYYEPLLEKAKQTSKYLVETFRDKAEYLTGWAHNFVCPNCGTTLIFDHTLSCHYGAEFSCPNCKEKAKGEKLEQAWMYYYRIFVAENLESVAICALLGDESAKSFFEKYLDFFADNYAVFPIHGHGVELGKIMPQMLDEAVWCIYVIRALYPCRHLFAKEKLDKWYNKLFLPLTELVNQPEKNSELHNHVLWHKCAVGVVALCFNDKEMLKDVLYNPIGIMDHVRNGMTSDGLWYECSPFYHYYVLEALSEFCSIFGEEYPNDELLVLVEKSFTVPLKLSWDGWNIMSLNDGAGKVITIGQNTARIIHRATSSIRSEQMNKQVERIREKEPDVFYKPSALLIDKPNLGIDILKGTKIAVIRNPFFATLKSGVVIFSHMHMDALSVSIPNLSRDLGTTYYGSPLYEEWYIQAVAHNTIAVDLAQPHEVLDTDVFEVPNGAKAVVNGGWKEVTSASRTLTVEGDSIVDVTEITLDKERTIDWVFHSEGQMKLSHKTIDNESLGEVNGYQYLKSVKRVLCDDVVTATFRNGDEKLTLELSTKNGALYTAISPDNPADKERNTLILRIKGDKAQIVCKYLKK